MGSRLENKVAIVTGGASGIGEAISKMFFDEGSCVCIIDTNNEKLRLLVGGGIKMAIEGNLTGKKNN